MNDRSISNPYEGEVLIVDDMPANLRLLVNLLTQHGCRVRAATSGAGALAGISLSAPDLILLDINMPGMDGYEVCAALKANPATAHIPIIFLSAFSESWDKTKAFSAGGVDYITKPFQTEEVLARVKIHLQLHRLQRNLESTNLQQAAQLAEQNQQLQSMNQVLEQSHQALKLQYEQLQQTQIQLVQVEKMATLGQLVAGIGHEISNPLTAIFSNLEYMTEYTKSLLKHIQIYQKNYPETVDEIQQDAEAIELDFMFEDIPKLLRSIQTGAEQLYHISHSLRIFARSDIQQKMSFNLHEGLDSTLLLLRHRLRSNDYRPNIEVIRQYGELRPITCYTGQINQVFMNVLANAIDALEEASRGKSFDEIEASPNQITITTEQTAEQATVRIKDNGIGIPVELQSKVFDYLFTTKPVGKGTGLGLAIARQIVEDNHGGRLGFVSQPQQGTEFVIELPYAVMIASSER